MQRVFPLLAITSVFALVGACSSESTQLSPAGPTPIGVNAVTGSAQVGDVDVCHVTGTGTFNLINVSANALTAHLTHGDGQPLGAVPGGGFVFSATCAQLPALPQAGASCSVVGNELVFGQGNGTPYGCGLDDNKLSCNPTSQWTCVNGIG